MHAQVTLLLIDEVHLLNESRGAVLEAGVVSRIKMISSLRVMSEVGSTVIGHHHLPCQSGPNSIVQSLFQDVMSEQGISDIVAAPCCAVAANLQDSLHCYLCNNPEHRGRCRVAPSAASGPDGLWRGDSPSQAHHYCQGLCPGKGEQHIQLCFLAFIMHAFWKAPICCGGQGKTDFLFERQLNEYLRGIITEYSKGKPTLIFCR